MKVFRNINDLKEELYYHKRKGKSIGFIPTMGFLHEGHLNLVRKSLKENLITVVSIFVNPAQFGPNEDYEEYPRDFTRDEMLLSEERVDYLFYPAVEEMYPPGFSTSIHISGLTEKYCGASRKGHFDGVALVVTKLLMIVEPTVAYFGLKDYQQFQVIKRLVSDLNIPCDIAGVEITRETDGLAMSSRNVFISMENRASALSLSKSFKIIGKLLEEGITSPVRVRREIIQFIASFPSTEVDYVEFADPSTLESVKSLSLPFVCLLAVRVDGTRLIDNQLFNAPPNAGQA